MAWNYDSLEYRTYAWIDSEMVPIWFTFNRRPLQAFFSIAVLIRSGFVTVKSSPTIWMPDCCVKCVHASQSSWSKGSSMETMGYCLT